MTTLNNANFESGFNFDAEVPQALREFAQKVLNGSGVTTLTSRAILNFWGFGRRSKHQMATVRAAFAAVGIRPKVDLPEIDIDERVEFMPADR